MIVVTPEMAVASEEERESHKYKLVPPAKDPIQAVCTCGWTGPYATEWRQHRESEGLKAAFALVPLLKPEDAFTIESWYRFYLDHPNSAQVPDEALMNRLANMVNGH